MNRNNNNKIDGYRTLHVNSFLSVHPPGGLVAWPDGSTTKIGWYRKRRIVDSNELLKRVDL